jgi:hypothetical protein
MNSLEGYFTREEAAAFFNVTVGTVDRWRRAGIGPEAIRVGSMVFFKIEDCEDVADMHAAAAVDALQKKLATLALAQWPKQSRIRFEGLTFNLLQRGREVEQLLQQEEGANE